MRKTTAVVAALLAAVIVLTAIAGCGNSNEKKAREYLATAKDKGKAVAQNQEDLKNRTAEFFKLAQSTQDVTPETSAAMKKSLADLVASVQATFKAAQTTRSEYEKVLALDDVAQYKEYARIQTKILDLIEQQNSLLNSFMAIVSDAMDAELAGQNVDQAALQNETKPILDKRDQVNEEIQKLNKQASDLADELKL